MPLMALHGRINPRARHGEAFLFVGSIPAGIALSRTARQALAGRAATRTA